MTAQVIPLTRGERYADTVEFLDAIRTRYKLASDAELARFLGWSHSKATAYRTRRRPLSLAACVDVAEALELPLAYVLAEISASRAPTTALAEHWREAAAMLRNRRE